MRETAKSLDRMLFKLQSISDIGSQQLIEREVRIKDLIREVIQSLQQEWESKKIRIQIQNSLDQNPVSNPVLLRIALENLLENAIHFARSESAEILVTARQQGDILLLSVKDNGEGIHFEFQNRIFEMYFRASEKSRGNGLGLYIVKKAAERLRGRITFQSEPYQGSVFTLEIPMA